MSVYPEKSNSCLPRPVTSVKTARDAGFRGKENGKLLSLAEESFDVLVTIDKNIRYQQNVGNRKIAILILRSISNDLDDIRPHIPQALVAWRSVKPGHSRSRDPWLR